MTIKEQLLNDGLNFYCCPQKLKNNSKRTSSCVIPADQEEVYYLNVFTVLAYFIKTIFFDFMKTLYTDETLQRCFKEP